MNLAILISGSGTTAEGLIKACKTGRIENVNPVVVVCSNKKAEGIKRAQNLDVSTEIVTPGSFPTKNEFGYRLLEIFSRYKANFISQNGWLPLTPKNVVAEFENRIINQHPAPLDPGREDFGGKYMYGRHAVAARIIYSWMVADDFWTESTIHYVNGEFDKGQLISTKRVNIPKIQTAIDADELQARPEIVGKAVDRVYEDLLPVEHENVIETISRFGRGEKPVFKRTQQLIKPENKKILHQAKKLAVTIY